MFTFGQRAHPQRKRGFVKLRISSSISVGACGGGGAGSSTPGGGANVTYAFFQSSSRRLFCACMTARVCNYEVHQLVVLLK